MFSGIRWVMCSFLVLGAASGAHADAIREEAVRIGEKDRWNGWNSPENLSDRYVRNFGRLPLEGRLSEEKIPWTDSYWPSNKASIANRWQIEPNRYSRYNVISLSRLRAMSREQISLLSPAEKYDIARGDYRYRVTHLAWGSSSPHATHWAGICNGWAQAALTYDEPRPVDIVNPDGIVVPFASSDVKALMSYFYALGDSEAEVSQMGSRCTAWGQIWGTAACKDIHPASFHIALVNQIGLMNEGFVADVDAGSEVWNHPVYGFRTRVLRESFGVGRGTAYGTVRQVLVETEMQYGTETDPQWEPVSGTDRYGAASKLYRYWLELSATDEILGGSWVTPANQRPDFIWTTTRSRFLGDFEALNKIYQPIGRSGISH